MTRRGMDDTPCRAESASGRLLDAQLWVAEMRFSRREAVFADEAAKAIVTLDLG
jgi:hypothetical protein